MRALGTVLTLSLAAFTSAACVHQASSHSSPAARAASSYLARVERVERGGHEELLSDGTGFRSNAFSLSLLIPTDQAGEKVNAHCDCYPASSTGPLSAGQCLSFVTSELVREQTDLDLANVQELKVTDCPRSTKP